METLDCENFDTNLLVFLRRGFRRKNFRRKSKVHAHCASIPDTKVVCYLMTQGGKYEVEELTFLLRVQHRQVVPAKHRRAPIITIELWNNMTN